MACRVLFSSSRAPLLRGLTVLVFLSAAIAIWALSLPPRAEWEEPLGPAWWWVLPAVIVALALALPVTMAWLHGRYLLRLEEESGQVRATVFLLWGSRTRTWAESDLQGASLVGVGSARAPGLRLKKPDIGVDWLVDQQGDFPEGEDALAGLVDGPAA